MFWTVRRGAERLVVTRHGEAGQARRGCDMAWWLMARQVWSRWGRFGRVDLGVGFGVARQAWLGVEGCGNVWRGWVRQGRLGRVRHGLLWLGASRWGRRGSARYAWARHVDRRCGTRSGCISR